MSDRLRAKASIVRSVVDLAREQNLTYMAAGIAVAALGWVFLQVGFQVYVSNASRYGAYGMIGAILLFVTWLYFASIVVLLGAAVNAVLQGIEPSPQ